MAQVNKDFLPLAYLQDAHPQLPFDRGCRGCGLSCGLAVGGAGPDDLTKVKLIVCSDYPGSYEMRENYPFYDNYKERQPKKVKGKGMSLPGWENAGAYLRRVLEDKFGLDTYEQVWFTNAIKCNPDARAKKIAVTEGHLRACVSTWLQQEFLALDKYVPSVPVLIAGRHAFRCLKHLSPELTAVLGNDLQDHRRTSTYKLFDHPLVFTFNPAPIARSPLRVETEVGMDRNNKFVVRRVKDMVTLPGSPNQLFEDDIEVLRQFL